MALDLSLTTHQLLSTLDGVLSGAHTRGQRLHDAVDRALNRSQGEIYICRPERVGLGAAN